MNKAFAVILTLMLVGLFGCIGQPQPSTGASNLPDRDFYSGRINDTGVYGNLSLASSYSRHVFVVWTSNSTTLSNTTTFDGMIATESCSATSSSGGQAGSIVVKYNDTTLAGANGTRIVRDLSSPERNTSANNMTITYQNNSSSNVTVYLNGVNVGRLNTSQNSTVFTLNGSNLIYGNNTVVFTNTGNSTNITNISIQYLNATFNCSLLEAADNSRIVLFETTGTSGQMNVSITNSTLNNTTTFEIDVYGGDLGVVTNTGHTYIGLHNVLGWCDPLGFGYPLAWNSSNWTNITGLSAATYAPDGVVTLCTIRTVSGNVLNYGAAIDYVALSGSYTYDFTGGAEANITFQTSLDNQNWFTDATLTSVGSAVRTQTNNTARYARFNVTGLDLTDPAQDSLYIRYYAVSN